MIIITSLIAITICFLIGRIIFGYWLNHLFIYAISWGTFAILYEIRLIRFTPISTQTWIIVLSTFLLFILGILTIYIGRDIYSRNDSDRFAKKTFDITRDNGKLLKLAVIFFSLLGLLGSIQHWFALIKEFGSIPAVLTSAGDVYQMKVKGEDFGQLPYLFTLSYVGIFLSAIYSAFKNKISLLALIPFAGVILKDMAGFARAGIFFSFISFLLTFIITRHALKRINPEAYQFNKKLGIAVIFLVFLAVGSATVVKQIRGSFENFKANTSELNSLTGGVISPSIYLYFSSDIAVLSKYFEGDGERAYVGQNTFLSVYNVLSKFGIVEHPDFFPKGYFIPMWTNSATYLRELHVDFGNWGLFIFPYLLGLMTTYFWFRFFQSYRVIHLFLLVYLNVIVSFSVFYMVTRLASWFFSFFILIAFLPIASNFLSKRRQISTNND